jgi:hypothetical protein
MLHIAQCAICRYYDRLQPLLEGMNILFKKTEADNENGASDEKRIGGREGYLCGD